jgi:hsp70-interacting protein
VQLLILGAIPTLVKLATEDPHWRVRKKAIRALSCGSRNCQPNLDTVVKHVPQRFKPKAKLDASNMESVDTLIDPMKEEMNRMKEAASTSN